MDNQVIDFWDVILKHRVIVTYYNLYNYVDLEINRVKFLQEAAIMGQFKHPVTMHGVVTELY